MEPLLGEYGFITQFSGLSEEEARANVRTMNEKFHVLEFQFYDAMRGYSHPPRPDQDVWENDLSMRHISRRILRAYVDEIHQLGGRSWLYVQAMATDPSDTELQHGGFMPRGQHIAGKRPLLDVIAINGRWAERISPQWALFAKSLGFSGIHWDTLAEGDVRKYSNVPEFLRAALLVLQAHGLEQTCNFIDGFGWDQSLFFARKSERQTWNLEVRISDLKHAGSVEGATFQFMVDGIWSKEQALGLVARGHLASASVTLPQWPTKLRLAAAGQDASGFESVLLTSDGETRVLLASSSGLPDEEGLNQYWVGRGAPFMREAQEYDVPAASKSSSPVRWVGRPGVCITVELPRRKADGGGSGGGGSDSRGRTDHDTHRPRRVVAGSCGPDGLKPEALFVTGHDQPVRWAVDPRLCLSARKVHDHGHWVYHVELSACSAARSLLVSSVPDSGGPGHIRWASSLGRCLKLRHKASDTRLSAFRLTLGVCKHGIRHMQFTTGPPQSIVAFPYWEVWHPADSGGSRFYAEVAPLGGAVIACYPGDDKNHEREIQNTGLSGEPPFRLMLKRWQRARRHGSAYLAVGDGHRHIQTEYFPYAKDMSETAEGIVEREVFGHPDRESAVRAGDVVYLFAHTRRHLAVHRELAHALQADHGIEQQFIIEREDGDGLVHVGDTIYLRAHTGLLLRAGTKNASTLWTKQWPTMAFTIERPDTSDVVTKNSVVQVSNEVLFRTAQGTYLRVDGEHVDGAGTSEMPEARMVIQKSVRSLQVPFDCWKDAKDWASAWPPRKRIWCCQASGRGCQAVPETRASSPVYDCFAAPFDWKENWSSEKMWFCCQTLQEGCPKDERSMTWVEHSVRIYHVEWQHVEANGVSTRTQSKQCLDGGGRVHTWTCGSPSSNQNWLFLQHSGHIVHTSRRRCLDIAAHGDNDHVAKLLPCDWKGETQLWAYDKSSKQLLHHSSRLCLDGGDFFPSLTKCSSKNHRLRWYISGDWEDKTSNATEAKEWRELGLREPYDCIHGGMPSWQNDWTLDRKHWCCSATLGAQHGWPQEQSEWCCHHGSHHADGCVAVSRALAHGGLTHFRKDVLASPLTGSVSPSRRGSFLLLPSVAAASAGLAVFVPLWCCAAKRRAGDGALPVPRSPFTPPRSPTRVLVPTSEACHDPEQMSSLLSCA
eukprot:CAMPEP_0115275248 /NCGR_PEP_ID=MMETSP0270-20121206/56100_1 /TAXON_ID=71861 /ORGANISM="Scrippsiella trochoidea, Strain CCMP3099" /LENGTH=1165 /DNA_ID=CAMNT_0002691799 /DNA_START=95 /DNA_END=3592 /DNA_ORIENTATION=-